MPLIIIELSIVFMFLSGFPVLMGRPQSVGYRGISTTVGLLGCILGFISSLWALAFNTQISQVIAWNLPGGVVSIGIDALSAFFLVPIFLIGGMGTVYQTGYWQY